MPGRSKCLIVGGALCALAPTPIAAQQSPQFGPAVEGICLFARDEALRTSEMGRDIARRIGDARKAVQQQVASEKTRIDNELARLRSNDSERRMELFDEMNTVNRFEANANNRIEQQTEVAFRGIEPAMESALGSVVTRRKCGLIVERSITYGWNSAMDITPAVVAAMNAGAGT